MTCTYLATRLRELSSTKTGSYPHEFLCRTNCSACADYQPCICIFSYKMFNRSKWHFIITINMDNKHTLTHAHLHTPLFKSDVNMQCIQHANIHTHTYTRWRLTIVNINIYIVKMSVFLYSLALYRNSYISKVSVTLMLWVITLVWPKLTF